MAEGPRFPCVPLPFQLSRLLVDLVRGGVDRQLHVLAGCLPVEKALAPRMERHFCPDPRTLASEHHVSREGTIVEPPERVVEPILDEGPHARGDGEMSSCQFETHSDRQLRAAALRSQYRTLR